MISSAILNRTSAGKLNRATPSSMALEPTPRPRGEDLPLVHVRDDVVLVEALVLGHLGQLAGGGDAHAVRDRPGPDIQGAPEDAGEAEGVVDLVREVGRPVATIRAPASLASQGQISGMGLASANTMASLAMVATHSA